MKSLSCFSWETFFNITGEQNLLIWKVVIDPIYVSESVFGAEYENSIHFSILALVVLHFYRSIFGNDADSALKKSTCFIIKT